MKKLSNAKDEIFRIHKKTFCFQKVVGLDTQSKEAMEKLERTKEDIVASFKEL